MEQKPFVIGVWMEYSPAETQAGQGISRLNSWIMRALVEREDVKIVAALAAWSEKDVRQQFKEHKVLMDRLEFITSRKRTPFLLQVRTWLQNRVKRIKKKRRSWWWRLVRRFYFNPAVTWMLRPILTTDSFFVVFLILLLLLLAFPVVFVVAIVGAILWKLFSNRYVRKPFGMARTMVEKGRQDWNALTTEHWYARLSDMAREVEDHEFRRLARKAARRRDVQMWYSPHPFATHVVDMRKPIVVAVPDLVYFDFVNAFGNAWVKQVDSKIRKVTAKAAATISYNQDVRDRHVVRHLAIPEAKAHVIRHGAVDVEADLHEEIKAHGGNSRAAAQNVLQRFISDKYDHPYWNGRIPKNYLRDFPFDEVPFLFVSSQIRPNKNYLNLFRAFEYLVRRRRRNLKLILTGNLEHEQCGLREFVSNKGLDLDILSIPKVPPDAHAGLYHLAALTVVPSLFEGGFPFQFTESMSVGTPVIMSDIAATREVFPKPLHARTLFDPTNPMSIADYIEWALNNRAELMDMQRPFFEELQLRNWDLVAGEYLEVFREVSAAAVSR